MPAPLDRERSTEVNVHPPSFALWTMERESELAPISTATSVLGDSNFKMSCLANVSMLTVVTSSTADKRLMIPKCYLGRFVLR